MAVQRGHEFMTAAERTRARRSDYPTPKASDGSGRGPSPGRYPQRGNLIDAVRYPSPRVGSGGSTGGSDLREVANGKRPRNWPTPMASDSKWRGSVGASVRRAEIGKTVSLESAIALEGAGWSRPIIVERDPDLRLWPTPRGTGPIGSKSHDYRVDRGYLDATVQDRTGESGPLNPDWVEWLMGFPIGWTDLEVAAPIFLEGEPWPAEPEIPRMRRDVPRRAARLKQLGNAVVPKNAELVGWRLRDLLEEVEPE